MYFKSVHADDLNAGLAANFLTLVLVGWFVRLMRVTHTATETIPVFFTFFIVAVVIQVVCSVLIIVGTEENRHLLFLPWLIFAVIGLVALGGFIIWGMGNNVQWIAVPLWIASFIHLCSIGIIFSVYTKIRTTREEERPENLGNLESGNFIVTKESLLA